MAILNGISIVSDGQKEENYRKEFVGLVQKGIIY